MIELGASTHAAARVPPTTSVEETYLHRIGRLPDDVRELVVLAAAEESGDRAMIAQAAGSLGLDPDRLAVAEKEGLIEVRGRTVAFRHPLVRSAAYRSALFDARERAHRALALSLTGPADSDRRAWHRAAATVGADDDVAAELEESAGRARHRGGYGAAASALIRAAELSVDDADRRRRFWLAAVAANLAGQYERAVSLADRAMELQPDPVLRADLALLRGSAELWHGRPGETSDMLATVAEESAEHDPGRALQLAGAAAEAGALACDVDRISRASRVATAVAQTPDDPRQKLLSLVPRGGELLFKGAIEESALVFRQAGQLSVAATTPRDIVWQAISAVLAGDYAKGQERYSAAAAQARELGAVGTLWYVLTGQALCNVYFAYVREAAEAAHEAVQLAADFGAEEHAAHAMGVLGWVAALCGDETEQKRVTEHVSQDTSRGVALPAALLAWGRAELALAGGRWDEALHRPDGLVGVPRGVRSPACRRGLRSGTRRGRRQVGPAGARRPGDRPTEALG